MKAKGLTEPRSNRLNLRADHLVGNLGREALGVGDECRLALKAAVYPVHDALGERLEHRLPEERYHTVQRAFFCGECLGLVSGLTGGTGNGRVVNRDRSESVGEVFCPVLNGAYSLVEERANETSDEGIGLLRERQQNSGYHK